MTAMRWDGSEDVMIADQTDPWLQVGDEVVDLSTAPTVDGPCMEWDHLIIPGVLLMKDSTIERCDACQLYGGDLEAAQALAAFLGADHEVWFASDDGH